MRKWMMGLALVAVVALGASQVYANPRVGEIVPTTSGGSFQTTVVTTSSVQTAFNPGGCLYGFTVFADGGTNVVASLYDTTSLTTASNTQGVFIDEGGTPTQYLGWVSSWPAPYKLLRGLATVISGSAKVVIYHEPQTFL